MDCFARGLSETVTESYQVLTAGIDKVVILKIEEVVTFQGQTNSMFLQTKGIIESQFPYIIGLGLLFFDRLGSVTVGRDILIENRGTDSYVDFMILLF